MDLFEKKTPEQIEADCRTYLDQLRADYQAALLPLHQELARCHGPWDADRRRHLFDQIHRLRLDWEARKAPFTKILVDLAMLKPMPPILFTEDADLPNLPSGCGRRR